MARNGSGVYAAPSSSWNPAIDATDIDSSDWAALLADLSSALTTSIASDGQTTCSASIPFAAGLTTTTLTASGAVVFNGTVKAGTYNTYLNFAGATPTGTTSATKVMMGLGSSWALTPAASGRVRITITGFTTNTLLGNAKINAYYGTGSAPANAAALTGTAFNATDMLATSANSGQSPAIPFTFVSEVTGLTVGTPYWFDLVLGSSSGTSAATITGVIIEERSL